MLTDRLRHREPSHPFIKLILKRIIIINKYLRARFEISGGHFEF